MQDTTIEPTYTNAELTEALVEAIELAAGEEDGATVRTLRTALCDLDDGCDGVTDHVMGILVDLGTIS